MTTFLHCEDRQENCKANLCMLLLWCYEINTIAQMHAFTAIDRVPIT